MMIVHHVDKLCCVTGMWYLLRIELFVPSYVSLREAIKLENCRVLRVTRQSRKQIFYPTDRPGVNTDKNSDKVVVLILMFGLV